MHRSELGRLDPTRTWWVAAVVSPGRDPAGAPGCRRGARFMVDAGFRASRDSFEPIYSRALCLDRIMSRRAELNCAFSGAPVRAGAPGRRLLGLD